MNSHSRAAEPPQTSNESGFDTPDEQERMILLAMRAWLRPHCDAQGNKLPWTRILQNLTMRADGIEHFDLTMRAVSCVFVRPLDIRCRCTETLSGDEATLLNALSLLQMTRSEAAVRLLDAWLPKPAASGVIKLMRWLAIDLLDAGIELRTCLGRVTYMH